MGDLLHNLLTARYKISKRPVSFSSDKSVLYLVNLHNIAARLIQVVNSYPPFCPPVETEEDDLIIETLSKWLGKFV